MSGARALVLGGTVFIGRHLVEYLLARGDAVTVLNRGGNAPPATVSHVIDRLQAPAEPGCKRQPARDAQQVDRRNRRGAYVRGRQRHGLAGRCAGMR